MFARPVPTRTLCVPVGCSLAACSSDGARLHRRLILNSQKPQASSGALPRLPSYSPLCRTTAAWASAESRGCHHEDSSVARRGHSVTVCTTDVRYEHSRVPCVPARARVTWHLSEVSTASLPPAFFRRSSRATCAVPRARSTTAPSALHNCRGPLRPASSNAPRAIRRLATARPDHRRRILRSAVRRHAGQPPPVAARVLAVTGAERGH